MLEALRICVPARRELVEERAKLFAQSCRKGNEPGYTLLRVFELLHMRNIATGLYCGEEAGMRCSLLGPGMKLLISRQTLEAPVDFNGRKVLRIIEEPVLHGKIKRVETPDPI